MHILPRYSSIYTQHTPYTLCSSRCCPGCTVQATIRNRWGRWVLHVLDKPPWIIQPFFPGSVPPQSSVHMLRLVTGTRRGTLKAFRKRFTSVFVVSCIFSFILALLFPRDTLCFFFYRVPKHYTFSLPPTPYDSVLSYDVVLSSFLMPFDKCKAIKNMLLHCVPWHPTLLYLGLL